MSVNIDSIGFDTDDYFKTRNQIKRHGANVRIQIMKDLFDDKDGYKKQTNESKILSHGFDLKESFRKRKES